MLVVRERMRSDDVDGNAQQMVRRKKKSSKRKTKRVDEVAEFMNQSVDSAHSATDYNILDEAPSRTVQVRAALA